MRIGLYIYRLGFGGAERVVCRASEIFAKHGHEVYIITDEECVPAYSYAGNAINLNIPHNVHGIRSLKLFHKRIVALKKIKKEQKFEVVISFLLQPNIINILAKCKKCRCYVSIRNRFISENYKSAFQRLFYRFVKFLYKRADGVISVSNLINQEAVRYLNVSKEKSFTLYNLYNIQSIIEESKKELEESLLAQLHDDTFKYVATGRFTHQKGFWHLIKAFSVIHNEDANTKLVLIGDGEQKEQILELVEQFNLKDSVVMPGFRKDVFAIEKFCNAYVMTSLFEGFPNALVEAMCLGLPIVSTDCKSGPKEILAPSLPLDEDIKIIGECDFGILLPAFTTTENWDDNTVEEAYLIESMRRIKDNGVNSLYSEKSKIRAQDFSEEKFYQTMLSIFGM